LIAYEPIWAIGTGRTPKPEEIEEVHTFLRRRVPEATAILYGGSVKSNNAAEILSIPFVEGLLVGGASWKPDEFKKIVEISGSD